MISVVEVFVELDFDGFEKLRLLGEEFLMRVVGGERIKRIGSEARQDLERAFDCKVYLEVWVKIKSGWSDNEQRLKSYGYE
jgi:hypothetical protein